MDWWWAYPVLGAVVGLLSGLLGIGGGAAMVPVLAFIFKAVGFAPDHVARSLWPCDEHAGELFLGVLHIDGSS